MTTKKKNYSTFGPEELTRYLKKKRDPITFGRLLPTLTYFFASNE